MNLLTVGQGFTPHGSSSHNNQGNPGTYTSPMTVVFDAAGAEFAVYKVYQAGVTYGNGDFTFGSDSNMYRSLVAGNLGNNPVGDGGVHWQIWDAPFLYVSGSKAMTGALDLGTHQIHNVVDPTSAQDAASKAYVDALVQGSLTFGKDAFVGDGATTVFALSHAPKAHGLQVSLRRLAQLEGTDYTIAGSTLTMTVAPGAGDPLWALYPY